LDSYLTSKFEWPKLRRKGNDKGGLPYMEIFELTLKQGMGKRTKVDEIYKGDHSILFKPPLHLIENPNLIKLN